MIIVLLAARPHGITNHAADRPTMAVGAGPAPAARAAPCRLCAVTRGGVFPVACILSAKLSFRSSFSIFAPNLFLIFITSLAL